MLIGGHTAVWGSTFDIVEKRWGYKCCLCFDKAIEKCTGEIGRHKVLSAREEVARIEREAREAVELQKLKEKEAEEKVSSSDSDSSDSSEEEDANSSDGDRRRARKQRKRDEKKEAKKEGKLHVLDKAKVKKHLEELQKTIKTKEQVQYFSLDAGKPITSEELEAYRLKR